ncbi:MAG TPA: hypothetical protein VKW78_14595 [Terriglobales bacterium]|nr:hypothetical protein [Terriglobales bacterium]
MSLPLRVLRGAICAVALLFPFSLLHGQNSSSASPAVKARQLRQRQDAWFAAGRVTARARPNKRTSSIQRKATVGLQATDSSLGTAATAGQSYIGTQWTSLGPMPMGPSVSGVDQDYGFLAGRATAVVVDQGDLGGNTVYLGAATGGLWKSTNAAANDPTRVTWLPLIDDQPTLAVGSIAIQPGNRSLILVGTGEPNSSLDSYYGLGILRTMDGGNHWRLINAGDSGASLFQGLAFSKITFSTDSPSLVVAAAASASEGLAVGAGTASGSANRGLYYSSDTGLNWHLASVIDPGGAAVAGASAVSVIYHTVRHMFYAAVRFHGFYSSSDGINWTRLANQPPAVTSSLAMANCPTQPSSLPNTCPLYRAEIAQVPGRDEMYVWYVDGQDSPTNEGIHLTRDGGSTWVTLNTAGISNCGDAAGCGTEDGTYALALSAVPNGSVETDIYAGSTNIYKCRLDPVSNPTCSANGGFVNLTHAYGCSPAGSYSQVHPLQHAIDFSLANPAVIYFANDGGLYRTTNGFAPGISGQCGTTSFPFDNLNANLGSLAQMVSLAQDSNDPGTLLGAATQAGAVAVASATSGTNGTTWQIVDSAATGFTAIDSSQWYLGHALGFGIQRCTKRTGCTSTDWSYGVSPADVQGDEAGFDFPFLLDPQNGSQILAGTCRVWRGPTGGGWASTHALSGKFDGTSNGSACAADSASFVRSLAAGGPSTSAGSEVIYAGTADGRVWVTTSANSGVGSWNDVSPMAGGFQDPACAYGSRCPYAVSSIAIDPRDATGQTAYATVLGFGIGHVWQTTSAGANWTDVTGNLPDAPVASVAVDPASGLVYIGSDIGVFAAWPSGASTSWSEVGPESGAGALPTVPVTQISIFAPGNEPPRLRAATYGRGVWEMPLPDNLFPDFTLAVSTPSLTIYPGSEATFQGSLTAVNGYSKPVSLSCYAGGDPLPQVCGTPGTVIPSSAGTSFSLQASNGSAADFDFRVRAQDTSGVIRDQPVKLRVIDFSLGLPSPASLTIAPGQRGEVGVLVTSLGSFDESVTISCPDAIAGVSCSGTSTAMSAGSAQSVPVVITTSSAVALGSYTVVLQARSADHLCSKSVSISLQVQSGGPDFSLSLPSQTLPAVKPGQKASTTITVTSVNGFNGPVSLSCAKGCTVTPSTLNVFPGQARIEIDTTGAAASNLAFSITASTTGGPSHSASFTVPVVAFGIGAVTAPQPVPPGGTATFSVELLSQNGYSGSVQLACDATSIVQDQSCKLTPSNATLTANGTSVVQGSMAIPQAQAPGDYTLKFTATDAAYGALRFERSIPVHVLGTPDFQISVSPVTTAITAGQVASGLTITVAPEWGFAGDVALSCASLPAVSSCSFTPAVVTVNGASQQSILQISTTAVSIAGIRKQHTSRYLGIILLLPLGLLQIGTPGRKRRGKGIVRCLFVAVILACVASCGGSGGSSVSAPPAQPRPGTPAGTFNVVVLASSGNVVRTANLTLTVN